MTKADLARKAGVTRQAVNAALNAGRIGTVKRKGREEVDERDESVKDFIRAAAGNKLGAKKGKRKAGGSEDTLPGVASRYDLDRLKLLEQIEQVKLETKVKRNEYVARELVRRVFAKLYSIDSNQLAIIGQKVAPEVAALCGVEKKEIINQVEAHISKEIYGAMEHIKKELDTFLKKIGTASID